MQDAAEAVAEAREAADLKLEESEEMERELLTRRKT